MTAVLKKKDQLFLIPQKQSNKTIIRVGQYHLSHANKYRFIPHFMWRRIHELASASPPYERVPNISQY